MSINFPSYKSRIKGQTHMCNRIRLRYMSNALLICIISAIAEVFNDEGKDSYLREDFNNAIYFYTEGIKVNCKDKELKAKLYSNRAEAHFCLGENFQLSSECFVCLFFN